MLFSLFFFEARLEAAAGHWGSCQRTFHRSGLREEMSHPAIQSTRFYADVEASSATAELHRLTLQPPYLVWTNAGVWGQCSVLARPLHPCPSGPCACMPEGSSLKLLPPSLALAQIHYARQRHMLVPSDRRVTMRPSHGYRRHMQSCNHHGMLGCTCCHAASMSAFLVLPAALLPFLGMQRFACVQHCVGCTTCVGCWILLQLWQTLQAWHALSM